MAECSGWSGFVVMMPHRGGEGNIGAGRALARAFRERDFEPLNFGHSLLTYCFNRLLVDALNLRADGKDVTHIGMLHNDVCPDDWWGDILHAEQVRTGADMIAAVVPIKDARALTSTAVEDRADPWVTRRLTMTEVHQLPETFAAEDLPWHGPGYGRLLLNTGCWLLKLGDWVDQVGPVTGHRPWFRQQDRIVLRNGRLRADTMPEDWDWSRQLQDLGLKLLATRKVPLYHQKPEYTNTMPWGDWKTDLGYLAFKKLDKEALAADAEAGRKRGYEPSCL